jgi:ADP-ribose pyrophosphatase YjhB (NUDIX family)
MTNFNHDTFYIRCRGVIIYKNKILLVKHSGAGNYYALPGGHMDYGETPEDCIKREILEELGIGTKIGKLFYVNVFKDKTCNKVSLEMMFEIKNSKDFTDLEKLKGLQRSHDFEIEEIVWVDKQSNINLRPTFAWEDFIADEFTKDPAPTAKYMYSIKEI